jgi:hypothetical protein
VRRLLSAGARHSRLFVRKHRRARERERERERDGTLEIGVICFASCPTTLSLSTTQWSRPSIFLFVEQVASILSASSCDDGTIRPSWPTAVTSLDWRSCRCEKLAKGEEQHRGKGRHQVQQRLKPFVALRVSGSREQLAFAGSLSLFRLLRDLAPIRSTTASKHDFAPLSARSCCCNPALRVQRVRSR